MAPQGCPFKRRETTHYSFLKQGSMNMAHNLNAVTHTAVHVRPNGWFPTLSVSN